MANSADNECSHGRLPGDASEPCGCWPGEPPPEKAAPAYWRTAAAAHRNVVRVYALSHGGLSAADILEALEDEAGAA